MGQLFIKPLPSKATDTTDIDALLPKKGETWDTKKTDLAKEIMWGDKTDLAKKIVTITIINEKYLIQPLEIFNSLIGITNLYDKVKIDDTMVHAGYCLPSSSSSSIFSMYNKPNYWTCELFGMGNVNKHGEYIARLTIGTIYDSFVRITKTDNNYNLTDATKTINNLCVFNGLYHARHKTGVVLDSTKIIDYPSVRWVVWYECKSNDTGDTGDTGIQKLFTRICKPSKTLHPTVAFLKDTNDTTKYINNATKIQVSKGSYYICHIRHIHHN